MTTQPTNLPVPSESYRDLKYNAGKFDEVITSFAEWYIDRFGNKHYTVQGLKALFDSKIHEWDQIFQQFLVSSGYQFLGDYVDGPLTFTDRNQYIRYDGQYWKLNAETDLDFTTTGADATSWATDVTHLSLIDGDVLRQELASENGFSLIGSSKSIASLKNVKPSYNYQLQPVRGFYDDTPGVGGGMFVANLASEYDIDHWMVFPSGSAEYVWVRQEREKGRTVLNCGARENGDITTFLQLAASNGWTVYQDNPYDVKTVGGISINVGVAIRGDEATTGRIVLDSTTSDEIFNPSKINDCWFRAEYARFSSKTCLTNTPYVLGVPVTDAHTGLIKAETKHCDMLNIGLSHDHKYGDENVRSLIVGNTVEMTKEMSDAIVATGRANMRGLIRTQLFDPDQVMTLLSKKYGSSLISDNFTKAYMPSLSNQDIGKVTGMFLNQKYTDNHTWNTNIASSAEVDFFCGMESGVVSSSTFRNVSTKFMSNNNSATSEYLVTQSTVVNGINLLFDDGAVNDYGIYLISDMTTLTGCVIRNNQKKPLGQFIGIWSHVTHSPGVLGSTVPVGNTVTGCVVDIRCNDYNGQYWRPFESPSVGLGFGWRSNTFIGGTLRDLVGGMNVVSNNTFINVTMPIGVELRSYHGLNNMVNITSGVATDARDVLPVVGKNSSTNINTAGVVIPWVSDDRALWTLAVESTSSAATNWQFFEVSSSPLNGTVTQVGGRYQTTPTDVNIQNVYFQLVINNGSLTLTTVGGTTAVVTVKYRWVEAKR
ncbi:hypothetical protein [Enterobacter hormaechei]|uniref:hypothetical protein n=1 Tax=Enterobacter hormaechei TaxID=158836 RepID=UPI0007C92E77|nr:hypothetical protein [Enterobacter hormaechei]OAH35010.1 hypothetical protein AYJ11_18170 [Enterobacter hormaechei subsp. xiangfangensis]